MRSSVSVILRCLAFLNFKKMIFSLGVTLTLSLQNLFLLASITDVSLKFKIGFCFAAGS